MGADTSTVGVILGRRSDRGAHPLLICDDQRISYADADRRSALLARGLVASGAGKCTHIGLLYPNGVDFVAAALAAARIGAVVIPFSTFSTAAEIHRQLVGADITILLAADGYRSHDYRRRIADIVGELPWDDVIFTAVAPQLRRVIFGLADLERSGAAVAQSVLTELESDVQGCDPLAVIYTSGSTGDPKGALHTHHGLLEHQRNLNRIRGLSETDKLFGNSPFFWIGGFAFGLLATLVAGSTLLCSNASDAASTLDLLEAEKPTTTNGFAAGVIALTRDPSFVGRDLSGVRRGNLYPIMAPDVRPSDPELRHNMLGMTEAGSVVLISDDDADQPEHRRGSYGRPAPGFQNKVIDPDTGDDVPIGSVGELCIRGPYLMDRYYGCSREECFDADDWFHTGDLVRTDSDGLFYFLGRAGAMIKTAGANVSPQEVEKALTKITGYPAYVVALPDPERGQVAAAVVVTEEPTVFDATGVRAALRSELSAYKIPRRFVALLPTEVPLLSSGKVDSAGLVRLFYA